MSNIKNIALGLLLALVGVFPVSAQPWNQTIGPGIPSCAYTNCVVTTLAVGVSGPGTDALSVTGTTTLNGNVAMAVHSISGLTGLSANNANGYQMNSGACSATVPTITAGRGSVNAGLGCSAAGNVTIVASNGSGGSGVNSFDVAFNGITAAAAATSSSTQTGFWCYGAGQTMIADTALCLTSARWAKMDIASLSPAKEFRSPLDELLALRPRDYQYRPEFNGKTFQKNPNYNGPQIGFIADEVSKVDSRLSTVATAGVHKGQPNSVRYENMVALVVAAMHQQQSQIISLETKNNILVERISRLERKHEP